MASDIIGIRIFKGESTTDVMRKECKYMYTDFIEIVADREHERRTVVVPGIRYMLDASKFPLPIVETDIFVPMTSVVQISFDLPF